MKNSKEMARQAPRLFHIQLPGSLVLPVDCMGSEADGKVGDWELGGDGRMRNHQKSFTSLKDRSGKILISAQSWLLVLDFSKAIKIRD